jgi:hypothetical protein
VNKELAKQKGKPKPVDKKKRKAYPQIHRLNNCNKFFILNK